MKNTRYITSLSLSLSKQMLNNCVKYLTRMRVARSLAGANIIHKIEMRFCTAPTMTQSRRAHVCTSVQSSTPLCPVPV